MKTNFILPILAMLIIGSIYSSAQVEKIAFPGAEGYGRFAGVDQPAKTAYFVSNLNDSGAGSLRDALSQSNRYIIFNVAGTITLSSTIQVSATNIYLAGQTAFRNGGEGITIRSNGNYNNALLRFFGSHVVVRYIRLRRGPGIDREVNGDNIFFFGDHWIMDHCSVSWSTDENINAGACSNGTLQNSIISEALYFSTHEYSTNPSHNNYETGHSMGSLFGWRDNPANFTTIYRNLFAHNDFRNPRITSPGSTHEVVNNLIYNNRYFGIELDDYSNTGDFGTMKTNVVKNLLIPGRDTKTVRHMVHARESSTNQIYMQGNIGVHRTNDNQAEWDEVGNFGNPISEVGRSLTAFSSPLQPSFNTLPDATDLEQVLLADVGANLKPDLVDQRIINDVINRTPTNVKYVQGIDPNNFNGTEEYYGIINDPSEVGGWPNLAPMTSIPADSDNDGMPNQWETANNLNPNNAADALADYGNGYPNIEMYLSEISGETIPDIVDPVLPIGCPTEDLTAPASWNVKSNIDNDEIFVSWVWTLNGQSVNLLDETDPGFGIVDAGPGYYVGTMNYLDANGLPQTQTCEINVTDASPNIIIEAGCPTTEISIGTSVNLQLGQTGVPANASNIKYTASVNPSSSGNGNVSGNSYNFTPQQSDNYNITVERCYETGTAITDHRTRLLASPNRTGYGENTTGGTNYVYPTNEAEFRAMINQEGNYVVISEDYANTEWGLTRIGSIASNVTIDGNDAPGFTLFPDYANGFPSSAVGNGSASILATHREDNIIIHSLKLKGNRSNTYDSSDPSYNTGGLNIRSSNVFIDHVEIIDFWDDALGTAQAGDFITISHVFIHNTDKGILNYYPYDGEWDRHITIHNSILAATQRNPWNTGAHFVHLFNNLIKDAKYGALIAGRLESQGSFRWTGDSYTISENNVYLNNLPVDMRGYETEVLVKGNIQSVNDNFSSSDGSVTTASTPSLFSIDYNYTNILKNTAEVEAYVLQNAGAIQSNSNPYEEVCEVETCSINVTGDCNESTIYQAEIARLVGVKISENGAYVNGFDNDGDKLIFDNVVASESGTYKLTIRYACNSYKENYVSINGGARENIAFPESNTPSNFTDKTIQVNLNEGNNTISIEKHWGWFDVDYIAVNAPCNDNPPQPDETIRLEAENGTPTGVNTATEASASAGKYLTGFDNEGDKITITANVENAGMYQLKVGYRSTSGDKKNDIYLNGMFLGNIQFLQSNTFIEMTVGEFYFDAGQNANTLEFIKSWGWMDVDYFELVAASNQAGNSNNNFCDRTLEIGYSPTANFYRGGIINSDATISENQEVEYIGTEEINLMSEFKVEKGAEFLTDIEVCE